MIATVKSIINYFEEKPRRAWTALIGALSFILLWPLLFVYYVFWDYWKTAEGDFTKMHAVMSTMTQTIKHESSIKMENDKREIDKVLSKVLEDLKADSVVLWRANIVSDERRVTYVKTRNSGVTTDFDGFEGVDTLFTPGMITTVSKMLRDGTVCVDHEPQSEIGTYLYQEGIRWGCAVKIPYNSDLLILGSISVGWNKEQKDFSRIKLRLIQAAKELIL